MVNRSGSPLKKLHKVSRFDHSPPAKPSPSLASIPGTPSTMLFENDEYDDGEVPSHFSKKLFLTQTNLYLYY